MGRALTALACDNCVPGDASGWYLPITAGVAVALVLAVLCVRAAARRHGVQAVLARVAAGALVVGPAGAVFLLASDAPYPGVSCGPALSASLSRPLPGHDLDRYQDGCRRAGEDRVAFAAAWAATAAGGAGVLMLGSSLRPNVPGYA